MAIVREFYKSGNLKCIASVEGGEILMLRVFHEDTGREYPIDKKEYKFIDGSIQYNLACIGDLRMPNLNDDYHVRASGDIYFHTSRRITSVEELVIRTNMLTEEVHRQSRRIEDLEVRVGTKVKNKTTFIFSNGTLVVGREINDPAFNGLCGWTKLFHINFTGRGGWRNIIWIKGFLENNSLGSKYDKQA
jgi:hypothetical protein